MTTVDSYSEQLVSRVRQAEQYVGAMANVAFADVLIDLIEHQTHMNRLILCNLRRVADMLQHSQEVQP